MSLVDAIIAEIEQEAHNTRKILALVPTDKFDWKPHEKSMPLKNLAAHIAGLAEWPAVIAKTDYLDLAEGGLSRPEIRSAEDLVREQEKNTQKSVEVLRAAKESDLKGNWVLRSGDHVILDLPKMAVIRSMAMNHIYHHRAQLGVYLRLLDIAIPGMYGPSADEMG